MQDAKIAKNRHLGTIAQRCGPLSSQLRHVSTIGKKLVKNLLNSNISSTCPHNMANLGQLQFTVNRIISKIFGAMTKDSYCEISDYFGIPTVEQLITNRHDRFLNTFRSQGNYVCHASADYVA